MATAIVHQRQHPSCLEPVLGTMGTSQRPSLVFHFDDQEEGSVHRKQEAAVVPKRKEQLSALVERVALFSSPNNDFAAKLLRDVKHLWSRIVEEEEGKGDCILLATRLSYLGYQSVMVRQALGGGQSCFRNLRHEFLQVRGDGDYEGLEFIVEPSFREQFVIPHPTGDYSALLQAVPEVFVGPAMRLVPVVQVLCAELQDSFEAQGLTCPPWRRTQSMLSKWLPARAKDTSFSRTSDTASPPSRFPSTDLFAPSTADALSSLHLQPHQQQQGRRAPPLDIPANFTLPGLQAGGSPVGFGLPSPPAAAVFVSTFVQPTGAASTSGKRVSSNGSTSSEDNCSGKSPRRSPQQRGLLSAQLAGAAESGANAAALWRQASQPAAPSSKAGASQASAAVRRHHSTLDYELPVIHKVKPMAVAASNSACLDA